MEVKVKGEFSEALKSFNTDQQVYGLTRCICETFQCTQYCLDARIDNFQHIDSLKAATTDVDKDTICCTMCDKSFSAKAFAKHVNMVHNEACVTGGCKLWPEEQTHINYYDAFQTVKIEIHENEDKAEIKENISSFEVSNMKSTCSKDDSNNAGYLGGSSHLKKEKLEDEALEKTETKENWYKYYVENRKVSVNYPSETRLDSTHGTDKSNACNICDNKCNQIGDLTRDIITHTGEKPFACNICDYKCDLISDLTRHIRTHTGEKPFACKICCYKCTQIDDLKQHIRAHTDEKQFTCNICDYKCTWNEDLMRHFRTHTGEKPFACNICAYRCTWNEDLKRHIKTHLGKKPYACNICDYRCKWKSDLKRHITTHTGEKPYGCNICDYKCSRKSNLRQHIKTHGGEKPFACNICDYKASHKCSLKQHLRTHAGA